MILSPVAYNVFEPSQVLLALRSRHEGSFGYPSS